MINSYRVEEEKMMAIAPMMQALTSDPVMAKELSRGLSQASNGDYIILVDRGSEIEKKIIKIISTVGYKIQGPGVNNWMNK